jgi:predicted amidophosphoribosyltransferase
MLSAMTSRLAAVLDLVLPARCVCCGAAGATWCLRCRPHGPPLPVRRPGTLDGLPAYALAEYSGRTRTAILTYKERGVRRLAEPLGTALAAALPDLRHSARWLVPAPSRPAQARARGGAHMQRVARHCAAALAAAGQPATVAPALAMSSGVRDSVGLDVAARRANLAGRVRPVPAALPPPGTRVVLLDDVLTTGVTAAACAATLTGAGLIVNCVLTIAAVI